MNSRTFVAALIAIAFLLPVAASAATTGNVQSQLVALLTQLVTTLEAELQQLEASLQAQNNQLTANPPAMNAIAAAASCTWDGQTIASGSSVTAYQSSTVPAGSQCVSETRTCTNGVLSGSYTNMACTVTGGGATTGGSCTVGGTTYSNGQSLPWTVWCQEDVTCGPSPKPAGLIIPSTETCSNGQWVPTTQAPITTTGGSCIEGQQQYLKCPPNSMCLADPGWFTCRNGTLVRECTGMDCYNPSTPPLGRR